MEIEQLFNKVVGKTVRLRRIAVGLTLKELGQKIGVTYQQVYKYEKGFNSISPFMLAKIAHALNTSIADLVADIDPNEKKL